MSDGAKSEILAHQAAMIPEQRIRETVSRFVSMAKEAHRTYLRSPQFHMIAIRESARTRRDTHMIAAKVTAQLLGRRGWWTKAGGVK